MKREFHKLLAMILALIISLAIVPVVTVKAASDTVFNGVDYALVYNYEFYMGHPDLMDQFGKRNDRAGALRHFVKSGMKEGRQASPNFNVQYYKANYTDLQKAFGNNLPAYYKHYIDYGYKEGRNASSLVRYKSIINVGGVAGELTVNLASTVSVSYARNTTTSFSFNGWAQLVNGISNITYDIKHKQTGTTYIIGNQATVYGAKNAQERSYQVECIQIKHLKNGENIINVFATDKNGKREAIGCIIVTVYDRDEWINPQPAGNGSRAIIYTNSRTGKKSQPITTSAEYVSLTNAKGWEIIARKFEFDYTLAALFGEKIYDTFPEYCKAHPNQDLDQALTSFLLSHGASEHAIKSLRNIQAEDIEKAKKRENYEFVKKNLGWLSEVSGRIGNDDLANVFNAGDAGFELYMLINETDPYDAMRHFTAFSTTVTSYLPIEGQFVAADAKCLNIIIDMCSERAQYHESCTIICEEDGYYLANTYVDRLVYLLNEYEKAKQDYDKDSRDKNSKYRKEGCAYLMKKCINELAKGNMTIPPYI